MKTTKTVSTASSTKEANAIIKGMTISELLNDLVLVSNDISEFKKEIKILDEQLMITKDSFFEDQANRLESRLWTAEYYYNRLNTTFKRCIKKIPDNEVIKLVDDLEKQFKVKKSSNLALKKLDIICDNVRIVYKQAA